MIDIVLSVWNILNIRVLIRAIAAANIKNGYGCDKAFNGDLGGIGVIIPVRNEEQNIARLLDSLKGQAVDEIIVVDDGSSDATVSIVQSFLDSIPSLRLVFADPLPYGWTGKNHACYVGYSNSKSETLIFVDADVRFLPFALEKIKRRMDSCGFGFLSISPTQLMGSFGEKIALPGLFLNVVANVDFKAVNDKNVKNKFLANGQIMAFSKKTYESIGTHAAVKNEVCEDVAIAEKVKNAQINSSFFYDNGSLATVRMYTCFRECIDGFSKNMSDIIGAKGIIDVLSASFIALFFSISASVVPVLLFCGVLDGLSWWLGFFASILWWGMGVGAVSAMRLPIGYTFFLPFGYLLFAYLIPKSYLLKIQKRRHWKGREY